MKTFLFRTFLPILTSLTAFGSLNLKKVTLFYSEEIFRNFHIQRMFYSLGQRYQQVFFIVLDIKKEVCILHYLLARISKCVINQQVYDGWNKSGLLLYKELYCYYI